MNTFSFALVFVLLFISSVVSMSHIDAEHKYALKELAIHEKGHYVRKREKK